MILDFLIINSTNLFVTSILLNTIYLTDQKLYLILIIDIVLNKIPIITIILILLYIFRNVIFKYIKETTFTLLLLLVIYYFIFGLFIYGIYNGLSSYIWHYLIKNFILNLIIYVVGLKYLLSKYNLIGEIDE